MCDRCKECWSMGTCSKRTLRMSLRRLRRWNERDKGTSLFISSIYFTEPFDLPEDTFFEELHPAGKEN